MMNEVFQNIFSKRQIVILLALFAVLALFFSLYKLKESPSVWYDEGFYIQSASNLAFEGGTGLRVSPDTINPSSQFITVGYPLIYPLALWFKIFGFDVGGARSLMALFLLGFLVAVFFFAKKFWGFGMAILVLALCVTFPPLYGNGKSVLGEVPGLLYATLFLLSFHNKRAVLAGVFAGLAIVTKPVYLLFLPAVAIGVLIAWRRREITGKDVGLGSLSLFLPLLVWFFIQFQGAQSIGGIFAYYINPSDVERLGETIVHNISVLFTNTGTLYLLAAMSAWIFALCIRFHKKVKISTEEIIAFIFSILISLAYLRTAGWFRYLFPAQIMSLIFLPHALFVVGDWAKNYIKNRTALIVGVIVTILALCGVYHLLFNSWVADSYRSDKTAFWEEYFVESKPGTLFFFYDTPEVAIFERTGNYHQYIQPAGTVIGADQVPVITAGKPDVIVAETTTYADRKTGIFALYEVERVAYKYSILRRATKK